MPRNRDRGFYRPAGHNEPRNRVRIAGYDPEGRRRVVCEDEDEAETLMAAKQAAEVHVADYPATAPLEKWDFRVEG